MSGQRGVWKCREEVRAIRVPRLRAKIVGQYLILASVDMLRPSFHAHRDHIARSHQFGVIAKQFRERLGESGTLDGRMDCREWILEN